MERVRLAATAVAAAGLLAGCGLSNPYQPSTPSLSSRATATTSTTSASTTPADAGDPAPERSGTIPGAANHAQDRTGAGVGSPTARAAVNRYAELYVNWTAGSLVANQRKLAAISIGAARQQAQQAAASAPTDTTLTADQVSNTGEVVSAQPGAGPATGEWVIVTSEKTLGKGDYAGLPPAVHVTYAKVAHTDQGYVISQWTAQN
jgi:hypothetical protein